MVFVGATRKKCCDAVGIFASVAHRGESIGLLHDHFLWQRNSYTANTMKDFAGQTVVITGASRGLGRSCAEAFAQRGADVVLVSRGAEELEAAAAQIRAAGGSARAAACDVTSAADIEALFTALPRCDVLINNAGGNQPQPFVDVTLETLDRLLALNVRSMFVTAQAAARRMQQARSGVILHMSSQMGHVGAPNRTVYCMTKHAIEGLTKACLLYTSRCV